MKLKIFLTCSITIALFLLNTTDYTLAGEKCEICDFFLQQESLNTAIQDEKKNNPHPEEVSIIIDTDRRKLIVLKKGEPSIIYPVAVGKHETPTPIGNWEVLRKAAHWGSGFGTRWIGLTVPWGIYGIHGTNKPGSIGSYASHGCIRMNNRHVEEVYPLVHPGTPVIVIGNPFCYQEAYFRTLRRGMRGADVMELQRLLKKHGCYSGPLDGIWGWGMEKAVVEFRRTHGLPPDNSVNEPVYKALGI